MARRAVADRRAFLKAGLWGGSCLAFGLGAARRAAEASGKPVFTEASFNQMMRDAQTSGKIKQIAAEAGRDVKGWLQRNFTLTTVQAQQVQGLSPSVVQDISKALAPVAQKGGSVQIFMTEQPAAKSVKKAQEPAQMQAAAQTQKVREAADQGGCQKFGLTARAIGGAEMTVAHTLPAVHVVDPGLQRQLAPQQAIQPGIQQQKVLEQQKTR